MCDAHQEHDAIDDDNSTPLTIDYMNMSFQERNLGFVVVFYSIISYNTYNSSHLPAHVARNL